MTLVVRNTFLTFSQQEDSQIRSSSAPPTCRQAKLESESAAESTTCETCDHSTVASDFDDATSRTTPEHADTTPPMSCCDSDDDNEAFPCSNSTKPTLDRSDAQEQLDKMSQTVMDIWSKLRLVESSLQSQSDDSPKQVQGQRLSSKAPAFTPSCCMPGATGISSYLTSIKLRLQSMPEVAAVEVVQGPAGTLATISITLGSKTAQSVQCVVDASKAAMLELAASSVNTYVLGYEAEPFQESASDTGFFATIATMRDESSACWGLYQTGVCHRRRTCRWQHPGRNDLQPVRVLLH